MIAISRRDVLRAGVGVAASAWAARAWGPGPAAAAEAAAGGPGAVEVLHPRGRVPLSFIIDDSTCLVNMGHYCMPQFAETWPTRKEYQRPWKSWPREIPDAFVREFGEWCAERGVKGKYSVVPNPACVGWLDRELPGWSRSELRASLGLVRELMVPNWDIHPEMITHTRVIDLKTMRPMADAGPEAMENWYPPGRKSVDELAAYVACALRVLKECGLPCEGITTPGGFGNAVKSELSLAVGQAVRDVFGTGVLPHYFKYVVEGGGSTRPKLEHVEGRDSDEPRCVVNVPAGTGDWFGGWDGDEQPQGEKYANADATAGRMVELIERGEPAVMLCHWPGMYTHGTKKGFEHFKRVVTALAGRFGDRTLWMKLSEIGRYEAARQLTRIERQGSSVRLRAPFACPAFTVKVPVAGAAGEVKLEHAGRPVALREVTAARDLRAGTWLGEKDAVTVCWDLAKGVTTLGM